MMINIIAVDNLRTLSIGATYGLSLISYYLLAALLFFLPSILVTAELATAWPNTGGVYVWVREAFGLRCSFLAIWLQWVYNIVWYPTIFSFIATAIAYLINPAFATNKWYMFSATLGLFWCVTCLNYLGLKVVDWINTIGALIGTLLPMLLIIALGVYWLLKGYTAQIDLSLSSLALNLKDVDHLAFLIAIIFGLMGMEMSAVHAEEVRNPQRDYPKALAYSGIIILLTLVLASLAIALVVPKAQLNLISGMLDAFAIFFKAYHLHWLLPLLIGLVIVGSLSGAAAWLMGPSKGLAVALQDNHLAVRWSKINHKGVPAGILFWQGIIVTVLCASFLCFPTINGSYWALIALTAQLALLFYILFFAAAIVLRYKQPHQLRAYQIPGKQWGMCLVAGTGMITCLIAIVLGFLPPQEIRLGVLSNAWLYAGLLTLGIIICCLPPLILHKHKMKKLARDE
jgi:amino acid transporter